MRFSPVDRCFWCIGLRKAGLIMGLTGLISNFTYIIVGLPEPMWALIVCCEYEFFLIFCYSRYHNLHVDSKNATALI